MRNSRNRASCVQFAEVSAVGDGHCAVKGVSRLMSLLLSLIYKRVSSKVAANAEAGARGLLEQRGLALRSVSVVK